MDPNVEVIVLSDDEDADSDHTGALDNSSVLLVEQTDYPQGVPETNEILDEDVTITFSRKANVLPHARFDCTESFSVTDSNVSEPEGRNAEYCEQCFCYICDQVASQCKFWTIPGFCHCNAHKRSVYWKSLRDTGIMGCLHVLNFTFIPADMDSALQRAESSLQGFACNLALKYSTFLSTIMNLNRQTSCICPCHSRSSSSRAAQTSLTNGSIVGCSRCYVEHHKLILDDYSPVLGCVCAFFNDAIKENPKTTSVMMLGAVKLFLPHFAPGSVHAPAISDVLMEMFLRALSVVQSVLVDSDLPASFVKQLEHFFQMLPLPHELRKFKNSLNVLSWQDPLLSAVLRGQNISGVRFRKGRQLETLHEAAPVVRTRVLKLQQDNSFRELARYLKVVKCDNSTMLQIMRDWIPFYLCKVGDYHDAIKFLFGHTRGSSNPASRLSPAQFVAYLRIFLSGHIPFGMPHPPQVEIGHSSQNIHTIQTDPLLSSTWTSVEGEYKLLKRQEVLKFALRVMNCNRAVFAHADSWVKLLNFAIQSFSSPSSPALCSPEPDYNFLIRTRDVAVGILSELNRTSQIQIPKDFRSQYSDEALLLLATQAFAWRLLDSRLKPTLSVILAFKSNPWVMRWLFSSLLEKPHVVHDLFGVIVEELLTERSKSAFQVQDTDEQVFIATFLSLFFMEPRIFLHPRTYPISYLLAHWNEFENPWQFHLRRMLEVNDSILSGDKQQVLSHMVQWSLHQ